MMKIKNKQDGFTHILLLAVIGVLVVGIFSVVYVKVNNASDKKSVNSDATKNTSTSKKTTVTPVALAPADKATTVTPKTTTTTPTTNSTPTVTPKNAAPIKTSPASNIVHPTIANCNRQNFTVYASVPSGTPAYSEGNFSQVLYTWPYGSAITDVYCDSGDSKQMVFRVDNPGSPDTTQYSAYHWADVSLTKP
ncbi:MAG TPA: hypothetical protein VLG92_02925 [Candidatus Saccharimonadia bacterium]|nr:hypothetical protein [Candidatus Saccharimonadia bacterium]